MDNAKYINDGFLVVGAISQSGCVSYTHKDRTTAKNGEGLEEDWSTHKVVLSIDEQRALSTTRRTLTRKISGLGTWISDFGIFVRKDRANELEAALSVANEGVRDFNAKAKYTRLTSNFTVFEISGGDERVAKALYDNTVELLNEMNECVEKGDVKRLRYAIKRMRGVSDVLPATTGVKLAEQIKAAREAAKAAIKVSKESGSEKQKLEKAIKALKSVKMDGLRASLIETSDGIGKATGDTTFVPGVDLTTVRQIEAEMKAPKPKKEKKAKKAKKRAVEPKPKKAKKAPAKSAAVKKGTTKAKPTKKPITKKAIEEKGKKDDKNDLK